MTAAVRWTHCARERTTKVWAYPTDNLYHCVCCIPTLPIYTGFTVYFVSFSFVARRMPGRGGHDEGTSWQTHKRLHGVTVNKPNPLLSPRPTSITSSSSPRWRLLARTIIARWSYIIIVCRGPDGFILFHYTYVFTYIYRDIYRVSPALADLLQLVMYSTIATKHFPRNILSTFTIT